MPLFYSTCPAGLEKPAARLAAHEIRGFAPKQTLSGAVIYAAAEPRPRGSAFQNTYLLLARRDGCPTLTRAAEAFLADSRSLRAAEAELRRLDFATWRVMFSEANRLQSVPAGLRARYERALRSARVDRVKPETELLVLRRSEGMALLLLRLSRPAAPADLPRGELSPALARCMAALADPRPQGAFLDPFAGHGALGAARLALGPARRVVVSEIAPDLVQGLKRRFGNRAEVLRRDALDPASFPEGSFSEIVTDPPWGLFEPLPLPEEEFCARTLARLEALLAPGGTAVVLTAAKRALERAAAGSGLVLRERFDLLVHGKKAAIFVLKKPFPEKQAPAATPNSPRKEAPA